MRFSKANIRTNLDVQFTPTTKFVLNAVGSFVETKRPYGVTENGLTDPALSYSGFRISGNERPGR